MSDRRAIDCRNDVTTGEHLVYADGSSLTLPNRGDALHAIDRLQDLPRGM
jgi:hypothetical protein